MAVTYDNASPDTSSVAGVSSLTSASWTIAGSDRLVIGFIGISASSPATHSGMKWDGAAGAALTQIGSTLNVGSFARVSAWRLTAPNAIAATSYGNWAATQDECGIGMVSLAGVDQGAPVGTPVTASAGTGGVTAVTATVDVTTVAGDKVFAIALCNMVSSADTTLAANAGTGCTERYELDLATYNGWSAMAAVERDAVGSTTTMNVDFAWTTSQASTWGIIAFVVNAAAGGGAALDESGWFPTEAQTNPLTVSVW